MSKLEPLFDRVIVKDIIEENGKGIILPSSVGEKPILAEVMEVSKGGIVDGNEVEMEVKKGDKVKKGDVIGQASDVGYLEFKHGPHVHFEMTKDGKHVCPKQYLNIK